MNKAHELFCQYYVESGCNGQKAYKKVYKKSKLSSAKAQAARLLKKPDIMTRIEEIQKSLVKKIEITRDDIINELASIGFAKIDNYVSFNDNGIKLKNSRNISEENMKAISEVVQTSGKNGNTIRLKLHSKIDALNSISRIMGYNAPDKLNLGIDFDKLSDEELDLIINKITEKAKNE